MDKDLDVGAQIGGIISGKASAEAIHYLLRSYGDAVIKPHHSHWADVKRKHRELQRTRTLDYLFDMRD